MSQNLPFNKTKTIVFNSLATTELSAHMVKVSFMSKTCIIPHKNLS